MVTLSLAWAAPGLGSCCTAMRRGGRWISILLQFSIYPDDVKPLLKLIGSRGGWCCFGSCAGPERREGVWGWTGVGAVSFWRVPEQEGSEVWPLCVPTSPWASCPTSTAKTAVPHPCPLPGDGSLPQPASDPTGTLQLHTGVTSSC